jgi:sugar-specific transcriptional regulator TrmB
MKDILIKLGFSKHEAKVYLALLELNEASADKIIKKTSLHRNIVYTELEKLISKKLASKFIKNKKSYFIALDPKKLLEDLDEKRRDLKKVFPEFLSLYQKKPTEIIIYEGERDYRDFWLRAIKTFPRGSTNYIAGSVGKRWWEILGKSFKEYDSYRQKRKIKWKMIAYSKEDLELEELKRNPKLTEIKIINYKRKNLGNFNIWADSLLLHSAQIPPLIIQIKNEALVKVFKQYFDFLWKIAKPLK